MASDTSPAAPTGIPLPSDRDPRPEPPSPTMSMDAAPSTTSFNGQTDNSNDE